MQYLFTFIQYNGYNIYSLQASVTVECIVVSAAWLSRLEARRSDTEVLNYPTGVAARGCQPLLVCRDHGYGDRYSDPCGDRCCDLWGFR
jgi:hypothetical protein